MANTSTVIVALPAADDAVNGLGPEQKHATLLYFGEIDDFTAGWLNAQILKLVSDGLAPFAEDTIALDELGEDDPPAQVVMLSKQSSSLEKIREALLESDEVSKAWNAVEQYPSFTPHVTLGYGGEVSDDDRAQAKGLNQIRFDRLALWHKDKQIEYPLDGRSEAVVAGVRFVRTQEGAKRFGVPIGSKIEVKDGKVVRIDKPAAGPRSGRAAKSAERPDPDRKPSKFVPTRPGQKAKIPLNRVAGGTTTSGLNRNQIRALGNRDMINKYGGMTAQEASAVRRLELGDAIGPGGKEALRQMIRRVLRKMDQEAAEKLSDSKSKKPEDKKSKAEKEKEEAAGGKEEKKPRTEAQKAADAKRQAAGAAASAFARRLRAAYKALGGNPKELPAAEKTGAKKTASKSEAPAKAAESKSSGGTAAIPTGSDGKRLKTSGFVGMGDKELTRAIRSLASASRTNKSSIIRNALRRAKTEKERRRVKQAERERRIERLSNPGGAA